jgi:hypothetical protein
MAKLLETKENELKLQKKLTTANEEFVQSFIKQKSSFE